MADVDVYIEHNATVPCGRISRSKNQHVFSYRQDTPDALSLTMPTRLESYQYDGLHPIFQMNLPEGALRQALELMTAKQYGSDDLTLLAILGTNQIGRIAYSSAGQSLLESQSDNLNLDTLLENEKVDLFQDLLKRYAQTSGVAGVQPKVLLNIENRLTLNTESYIVKSWDVEYPELACNEFVCMSMAKAAGLTVPEFYLSNNAQLLISKRFDIDANGHSLGFEDFCVLQAKGTRQKYDSSLEACTNTIRQFVSPSQVEQALYDFYKLTLLNISIRNGDAHLKNSGVVYENLHQHKVGETIDTERRLAPIFDLVSTVPYLPNDSMALTLTGSKRWPKPKVIKIFGATHCQLSNAQMQSAEQEVADGISSNLPLLEQLAQKHSGFQNIAERMLAFL